MSLEPFNRLVRLAARAFYDDITMKGDNQPKTGRGDNRGMTVVVLDALTRASYELTSYTKNSLFEYIGNCIIGAASLSCSPTLAAAYESSDTGNFWIHWKTVIKAAREPRHQWVREEDLAKALKLHSKQLRHTLRFFEEEKLVTRDHQKEDLNRKRTMLFGECWLDEGDGSLEQDSN